MDALWVCYPQYWLHDDDEQNFEQHFMLIKIIIVMKPTCKLIL